MFRRLTEASGPALTIEIDGMRVPAQEGDSVAAAMLACGRLMSAHDAVSGPARAPFCMMGVCFDCLVTIDGVGNRQACMTAVRRRHAHRHGAGQARIRPMTAELRERYDVAVVGAGPAGLAAASFCARAGLDTVLLDEQAVPADRFTAPSPLRPCSRDTVLGDDYWGGARWCARRSPAAPHYVPDATVWGLLREGEFAVAVASRAHLLAAKHVILATGAMERPFPIPGWTLPGVMTAGGAQILLKSSGLVPRGRTVLAGMRAAALAHRLAISQCRACGSTAVLDTAARAIWPRALRHAAGFAASPYLAKGLRLDAGRAARAQRHRQRRCARGRRRRQARSGDLSHLGGTRAAHRRRSRSSCIRAWCPT